MNGGVAAAQNTGLRLATGRYVAFLHSDDEFLPRRLERMVPLLDASEGAAGVESGFELRENGQVNVNRPYLDGASSEDLLAYRAGVHISTLLLRREHAIAVGFDERLRGTEDRDFCIRLLRRAPVVSCDTPLVRINRSSSRLGKQPKGPIYEYLLAKYADDIVGIPDVHSAWLFRIATAVTRDPVISRAHAVRCDPQCAPIRTRCGVGHWVAPRSCPTDAFAWILRCYLTVARFSAAGPHSGAHA